MAEEKKRLAIICIHGSLDVAFAAFVLATAGAAMEMETAVYFAFYGLEVLKKGKIDKLKVSPLANPAMPVKIPNIVAMLPGMTAAATSMMKSWMKKAKVASLGELMEMAKELGVRLIACQMSMDVMGIKKEELIEGVEIGGAATFLEFASHNAITLTF
ncbi:MAG TPA: peroxiredoxin family protein [Candidatus Aminicenantes bacterium]|nr:MAG: peroxiredoxin family protein [Candidatus Aminicenantes bacterium]HEK85137.1 peroxiredoxin family protein [Candidatus Aminicenantes bacterium]